MPLTFEVALQSAESHTDDVAVMETGAEILGEPQPEVVGAVEVFGPQPRRMRSEVDVGAGAARSDDFEGERVARIAEPFPRQADLARELFGVHAGRDAGHEP